MTATCPDICAPPTTMGPYILGLVNALTISVLGIAMGPYIIVLICIRLHMDAFSHRLACAHICTMKLRISVYVRTPDHALLL